MLIRYELLLLALYSVDFSVAVDLRPMSHVLSCGLSLFHATKSRQVVRRMSQKLAQNVR